MKQLKLFMIIIVLSFTSIHSQKDTLIFNMEKQEYEISYWTKIAGKDSFMTVIFIPSNKVVPQINAKVEKNISEYCFNYKIENQKTSKMPLEQFFIEIDSSIYYETNAQNEWYGTKTTILSGYCWFGEKNLEINSSLDGFIVKSSNTHFVGIGNAYFLGRTPMYQLTEEETSDYFFEILDSLSSFPLNYVQRKTIVPVSIANNISHAEFIDTLKSYIVKSLSLTWINHQPVAEKYDTYLTNAKSALHENKFILARCYLQDILREVDIDSSSTITSEAYALLRYNTEYLISKLPPVSGLIVRLTDSNNNILTGGTLQYYEGSWKNAVDNQDGTFLVSTNLSKVSLRMTYAYGSQTLSNVIVGNDIVTFKTVNAVVQLKDSGGNLIDQGSVQYYSGAWREFGVTTNGISTKELLPNNYSFRITYAFASNDIQQDISTNNIVVFQTVNASVQLKNSLGDLIDQGVVQYYAGAWRDFGVTTNGIATKELLPNNYSFRMTYAYGSNDKQQNIGANPVVVFNTVRARVELRNSQGNLIDGGTVQYYSGGWREFGTTENGIAAKELLSNNYSFKMSYAFASNDKQQNIGDNATVVFQTINTVVELRNSQGNLIDGGIVQYYSGGWRSFGSTTNGTVSRELLPNNYSFRMTHEYISSDKTQNIGTNGTVVFSTVLCTIQVRNAQNQPLNNALASYYSGGWRTIGNTVNGEITKELLPANLTFRVNYNGVQKDITQNLSTNDIVQFVF